MGSLSHLLGPHAPYLPISPQMIASCGGENSCITFEQFKAMMLKDMKVFSSTNRKWASSGNLSALSTSQKAKSAKA